MPGLLSNLPTLILSINYQKQSQMSRTYKIKLHEISLKSAENSHMSTCIIRTNLTKT